MHTLDSVNAASLRDDVPEFRAGDSLKVHVKVVEGSRSRVQVFAGIVIRRQGGGISETFTVRKVSFGCGVERTFPVHSPIIEKIELVSRGDVRRAKLYYIRDKAAREIRRKMRSGRVAHEMVLDEEPIEEEIPEPVEAEVMPEAVEETKE